MTPIQVLRRILVALATLVGAKSYSQKASQSLVKGYQPPTCLDAAVKDATNEDGGEESCLSTSQPYRGLLSGLEVDSDSARYFTSCLPMKSMDDLKWLKQPGLAWEAAKMDARGSNNGNTIEYITQVLGAVQTFQQKKDKVHDREDFYSFLERMVGNRGSLSLVLGGKSVGKSLVLNDFKNQLKQREKAVLLVDARTFGGEPLSTGILKEWKQWANIVPGEATSVLEFVKNALSNVDNNLLQKILKNISLDTSNEEAIIGSVKTLLDAFFRRRPPTPEEALTLFLRSAELAGQDPVLIIDEANLVLGLGDSPNATSSTLAAIVQLTKQSSCLTVIMASSEYAFPYALGRNGLNLLDITKVLFAGEIPPKSMWDLLVNKNDPNSRKPVIGMGSNLARLMIDAYGGHFLRIISAVELLLSETEEFALEDGLPSSSLPVIKCLEEFPNDALPLLRSMAQYGFAPVANYERKVVDMIVKENVGGIVRKKGATIVQLPRSIWENTTAKFGLVPSSETMRLVIAEQVCLEEDRRLARHWRDRLAFWRKK